MNRSGSGRHRWDRRLMVVGVWAVATLVGLVVAATTEIGPVLIALSHKHGVHLGDVMAFGIAYAAALLVTIVSGRSRR